MTMAGKAAQADAAEPEGGARRALMAQKATEMAVKVDTVEEAKEAPATPTMEDKVVVALMAAEEATKSSMGTTKTSLGGINNILSCISDNECLLHSLYLILRPSARNQHKDSYANQMGSSIDTDQ